MLSCSTVPSFYSASAAFGVIRITTCMHVCSIVLLISKEFVVCSAPMTVVTFLLHHIKCLYKHNVASFWGSNTIFYIVSFMMKNINKIHYLSADREVEELYEKIKDKKMKWLCWEKCGFLFLLFLVCFLNFDQGKIGDMGAQGPPGPPGPEVGHTFDECLYSKYQFIC